MQMDQVVGGGTLLGLGLLLNTAGLYKHIAKASAKRLGAFELCIGPVEPCAVERWKAPPYVVANIQKPREIKKPPASMAVLGAGGFLSRVVCRCVKYKAIPSFLTFYFFQSSRAKVGRDHNDKQLLV